MKNFSINLLINDQGLSAQRATRARPADQLAEFDTLLSELHRNLSRLFANPNLRTALAADRNSPAPLLRWLAQDVCEEVRLGLARNPASPPAVLHDLAREDLYHRALAANPSTPAVLLAALAESWNPDIRQAAANNQNMPPQSLAKLARDSHTGVKQGVASNKRCPPRSLNELADEDDLGICRALVRNANTPREILNKLATHSDRVVQRGLERHSRWNKYQSNEVGPCTRAA